MCTRSNFIERLRRSRRFNKIYFLEDYDFNPRYSYILSSRLHGILALRISNILTLRYNYNMSIFEFEQPELDVTVIATKSRLDAIKDFIRKFIW